MRACFIAANDPATTPFVLNPTIDMIFAETKLVPKTKPDPRLNPYKDLAAVL